MNAMTKITNAGADATSNEVRFPLEHVLTSATDPRGVIGFASAQFCDVAGYNSDDLMGAPHKIVRHADMPKGLFYLAWEALKAGHSVAAYVKNKTKSGEHYWVIATMTPTENGYLSARVRPSSDIFEATKEIYAQVLKEEEGGLAPEQSAARILELLGEAGYANFEEYGLKALNAEFKARDIVLADLAPTFQLMDDLSDLIQDMRGLVNSIEQGFERVRGEPVNLRILAGRLEGAGAALGTISQNYDAMAKEMHGLVGRLDNSESGALTQMFSAVTQGRAALQMAQLLHEAHDQSCESKRDAEDAVQMLKEHHERLQNRSRTSLIEIGSIGKSIPDICRSLRRRINGLDVVKLLCKVESGRMRDVDSGLDGIIARLENFHDNTDSHLADLSAKASQVMQKGSSL